MNERQRSTRRRATAMFLATACVLISVASAAMAHPLGNFTINHFARLNVGADRVAIRYVIDLAEIPTLQELQQATTKADGTPTQAELDAYLQRVAAKYADGLVLTIDGARVPLETTAKAISLPTGAGGLPTMRIECDFTGAVPAGSNATRRLRFEDTNHRERIGWRELVVVPAAGTAVFNSDAYANGLTDEIKAYPQDMLAAPLHESTADLSFARGTLPAGATALRTRDGRPIEQSRDRLAELIAVPELTPLLALFGLLLAGVLGALHAFSPGHGKTVVGAYLVGSRGTAKHAAFLGLTVTITHTLGVFALGVITLFASQYIVPEQLFPVLSFVSGAIVLVIGFSLFARRLRAALNPSSVHEEHSHSHGAHSHDHGYDHSHDHTHDHDHLHTHDGATLTHSHDGGTEHSHLPPGADGSPVTWRSLLALGISGGLLPCPSALVVLLSAISLHRVGYGLFLVVAFSIGLASTLTAIGLAFVYAGRWMKRPTGAIGDRLVRVLPVLSAFVIGCVGAGICYEAIAQAGYNLPAMLGNLFAQHTANGEPVVASTGALAVLGLGLVFGLKHATEVDHVVAVSTIVSEHRQLSRAALVGGLWGVGHTASLVVVGTIVLLLRVAIPDRVANWLEFGVALMIIGLGANAFARALRRRSDIHVHAHQHDGLAHAHIHFHEAGAEETHDELHAAAHSHGKHSHAVARIGIKPLMVGAMHGLAGSAALTLLVLTQINSPMLGLLYLFVFGAGSIVGMLLMSGLVGLPFALSARKLTGIHYGLQALAGAVSIVFGFWYAYETGVATGLLGTIL
ncbi:MAG: sulfite exporter TauE/SafE family protein [Pyrinomonadaceae bacterium]